jgi:hypothetical protein
MNLRRGAVRVLDAIVTDAVLPVVTAEPATMRMPTDIWLATSPPWATDGTNINNAKMYFDMIRSRAHASCRFETTAHRGETVRPGAIPLAAV